MSQPLGREEEHVSSPASISPEKGRSLQKGPPGASNGGSAAVYMSDASRYENPFGAIHVDAAGVVQEHRLLEACASTPMQPIIGRELRSLASWANEPDFVAALQSAIDTSNASFHFDFRTAAAPRERLVHVNILAVGDKTAWIFISDKTLAMVVS